MKKAIFTLSVLTLFAVQLPAREVSVISGKLFGHDGQPMLKGEIHLQLAQNSRKPLQTIEAAADGSFKIEFTETGLLFLNFTGVNHYQCLTPILVEKPLQAKVEVSLKHYEYVEDLVEVNIIGDFNNFRFSSAKSMRRMENGTFVFSSRVEGNKLAYQLLGVEKNGHSINGTQADLFEYDNGGDYRSVVNVSAGNVNIVFTPDKLIHGQAADEAMVRFDDRNPLQATLFAGVQRQNKYIAARRAHSRTHQKDQSPFTYDWSRELSAIQKRIATTKNPTLKQVMLIQYLQLGADGAKQQLENKIITQSLTTIPPASPLWSLYPNLMAQVVKWSGDESAHKNYLEQASLQHPDKELRAFLLFTMLEQADREGNETRLRTIYNRMMHDVGDTGLAKYAKTQFNPDRAIRKGKQLPVFAVSALDHPEVVYTNKSMKDKLYLIDFWAAWCGPCVAEMPNLHSVYEKYKDKNFEILSLSFDRKPEDINKFRNKKWRMPWLHSYIDEGFKSDLAKSFQVTGIPKPIFIDGATNTIIATATELRGNRLEKTVAKYLDGQTELSKND